MPSYFGISDILIFFEISSGIALGFNNFYKYLFTSIPFMTGGTSGIFSILSFFSLSCCCKVSILICNSTFILVHKPPVCLYLEVLELPCASF